MKKIGKKGEKGLVVSEKSGNFAVDLCPSRFGVGVKSFIINNLTHII